MATLRKLLWYVMMLLANMYLPLHFSPTKEFFHHEQGHESKLRGLMA
jgi:hypothetical protein